MKTRVAVVYGGRSGEHEVSVRSARAVLEALDRSRYEVEEFFIGKNGKWSPRPLLPEPGSNGAVDVVFPVLHGTFGEDGTVQGLLEMADVAYVGGGVFASSAAMDKDLTKRLLRDRGVAVVDWVTLFSNHLDPAPVLARFAFPVFVKPANLGSSVGISKARDEGQLREALREAARFDHKIIVERAIAGRELECAVLGNRDAAASTPSEILPSREFYDYEDKYLLGQAQTVLPADLTPQQTTAVKQIAVEAFHAVECTGMARVDFFLEHGTGRLYVNEINTIPGFTSISMYPKMWEHDGLPFAALVDRLISLALERHRARRSLRYER